MGSEMCIRDSLKPVRPMGNAEDKLDALRRCKTLLQCSEESAWAGIALPELIDDVDNAISAIQDSRPVDKQRIGLLFAPTGSIQETAIDNGWGDEFIALASPLIDFRGPNQLLQLTGCARD